MENKETETRNLTLPKKTWEIIDQLTIKYGYVSSQETIRNYLTAILKQEPKN